MKTNNKILLFLLTMVVSSVLAANAEAYLGSSTRKLLQYKDIGGENLPEKTVTNGKVPAISSIKGINAASAVAITTAIALNVTNSFIEVAVGPDGKFNMGGLQPSPWDLLFNWPFGAPWSSFATVQIDGTNYVYGETAPGAFIQAPSNVSPTKNISTWQIGPIIITQTLEIVSTASSTGNQDMLKIQYTVQNTDTAAHTVGVRTLLDTEINYDVGVAVPFRLPVINDSFTTELEVLPPIPPFYQAFGDLYDTLHVVQGTLNADGATAPDVLQLVSWPDIYDTCYTLGNCWAYTVTPLFDITGDSGVALYWNPAALAAGTSRTYSTFYGIGGINACPDPLGISVGVSGPAQATLDNTGCQLANTSFTIVGYVQNDTGADLVATESLTLTLPPGLALASPTDTLTHALPLVAAAGIAVTSWDVVATAAGTYNYTVTESPGAVACSAPVQKTVFIPATPGTDADTDTYCSSVDCNDNDPAINPGATEVCGNAVDDNCDGLIDEGCGPAACGDGICNGAENCTSCAADCGPCLPACGDSICNGTETCDTCEHDCGICQPVCGDGICNGSEDCASCPADCSVNFYPDADTDTFGDSAASPTPACAAPAGFVENNLDCNDANAAVNPNATEVCNGIDDNCNGQIDEGCPTCGDGQCNGTETCSTCPQDCGPCPPVCTDADKDGFFAEGGACGPADCDDTNAAVNPNATEVCNGIDDNCNGQIDEGCPTCGDGQCNGTETCSTCPQDCGPCPPVCTDADKDGFFAEGGACGPADCDDTNAAVNPNAAEVCNGIDDNCNGQIDEGCPPSVSQLIRLYYLSMLGREPDQAGWDFWNIEITRITTLGIDIKEGFQSLALFFFNCAEYQALAKTDTEFVTDLYRTFLQREPEPAGLAFWVGELSCVPRSMLITHFAYCAEFTAHMTSIFGPDTSRPENNLLNDFYRGILNRLPDDAGYNSWLTQMRAAQCTSAQAVRDVSYQIALAFVQSAEYAARNRTDAQYVEDLYNAILRRGAECTGFQTWTTYLNAGLLTRQEMLQFFTSSLEFQGRVDAVIAAGCLP